MPALQSSYLRSLLDRLGPLLGLIGVWSLFAALRWHTFPTWDNTQTILLQTVVVGIAALGATLVIISGGIDLSVGSLAALVSVVVAYVIRAAITQHPSAASWPTAVLVAAYIAGIALAMLCGLAIGTAVVGRIGRVASVVALILGGCIAYHYGFATWRAWTSLALGGVAALAAWWADRRLSPPIVLSPFIVTLGAWGAFRGIAKGLADNSAIYVSPLEPLVNWLMHKAPPSRDAGLMANPLHWLAPGVWIFLGLCILVSGVLRYTPFGRRIYAIGSNELTARLCGIHVERTKLKIYAFAAALTGIAGVLQFSFNNMGDPMTATGLELQAIAAVVIGGASLSGGVGGVLGTVAGALIMSIIDNGCNKVGLANWMQEILTGGIIIAAVALDRLRRRTAD